MRNDNDVPPAGEPRGQGAVQSVDRALTILEILARGEAGVGEIAAQLVGA